MLVVSDLVLWSKRNWIELCCGYFLHRLGRLQLVPSLFVLGPLGWNDDRRDQSDLQKVLVLNHRLDGLELFLAMLLHGGFPIAHFPLDGVDDPESVSQQQPAVPPAHVGIGLDRHLQIPVFPVFGGKTCSTVVVLFSTCLQCLFAADIMDRTNTEHHFIP